jgi:hypothetical protein
MLNAECHYAECRYSECFHAECSNAECRDALFGVTTNGIMTFYLTTSCIKCRSVMLRKVFHFIGGFFCKAGSRPRSETKRVW